MAAPLKPWERSAAVNQRQPSFNPDVNSFLSSPHMSQIGGGGGGGGGGGPNNSYQPPVPPRPSNYGSSSPYQSYRSYNTFGGYGGFGSSPYFGGAMGAYGGYGGYGGYNRLGMGGDFTPDENGFIQVAEESSRQAFQSIESIVHAFGSVSMMLESTYHAVHSSFRAVLGVAEHFSRMKSHFAQIFSALAVVRTLRWLYRKLLYLIGLRHQDPSLEAVWRAAGGASSQTPGGTLTEADLKASRSSWPIVMFLAVVFGGPYLIWRLLSSLAPNVKAKSSGWRKGEGEHYAAVGMYNFQAGNNKELSFTAGQSLVLAPKSQQPNVRGWLLASNMKNMGLVPANYIKILGLRQGSTANVSTPQQGASSRMITSRIPSIPQPVFAPQPETPNQAEVFQDEEVDEFEKLSSSEVTKQHDLSEIPEQEDAVVNPSQFVASEETVRSDSHESSDVSIGNASGIDKGNLAQNNVTKTVHSVSSESEGNYETKDTSHNVEEKNI